MGWGCLGPSWPPPSTQHSRPWSALGGGQNEETKTPWFVLKSLWLFASSVHVPKSWLMCPKRPRGQAGHREEKSRALQVSHL